MTSRPAFVPARKQIGQILVEGAFITGAQLDSALARSRESGRRLGETLVEQGLVSPETLATILSFQLNVPIVDLKQYKVQLSAIERVPEAVARQHLALPLAIENDTLVVAFDDPQDLQAIDTIKAVSRLKTRPVISLHGGIRDAIDANYKLTRQITEQVQAVTGLVVDESKSDEAAAQIEAVAQAPIVRAVDMLLTQAVKDRASDVHIEPDGDQVRVRYRIDGVLHDSVNLPIAVLAAIVSRIKVMANLNIAERRRPQDGQFTARIHDREIDFRVATIEADQGEMVVMRVLDKTRSIMSLAQLGFQPEPHAAFESMLAAPFGMILVSGPTGSGKTTTLYSAINSLDRKTRNLITIEDPIEYRFPGINQIQVNRQADITFASGLRSILRLDPDVILVGEIRDPETAQTAVQAALTGHLVLSSIHANDSAGALVRLIDLGVEPFLASSAVVGSVAQRLVRRVCPECRHLEPADPAERAAFSAELGDSPAEFATGRGCNYCGQTGFLGRIGVYEVMKVSDDLRALLASGRVAASEIKAQGLRDGMMTMRHDGMLKTREQLTTPTEVMRNVFSL